MRVSTVLLAALSFLGPLNLAWAQERPLVVAVNYPIQYFASRLVEDDAEVRFPVPEGVDPSFWRPTIADISLIQSADLILLNGAGFATWIDRVSLPRAKTVDTSAAVRDRFIATETVTHSHGDGGEHSHEGIASYIWLDPSIAIAQAEAIASAVIARGIATEGDVNARLARLRSDLTELDAAAGQLLQDFEGVPMIATHPRYQYLARSYGLSIASLEWEAGATPTEEERADLEAMIASTDAQLLIWEAAPDDEAIAIASELGVKSVILDPLSAYYGSGSYLDVLSAGVKTLGDTTLQIQTD